VDPLWFHCGSGSSFLFPCGFRFESGSRESNQCRSMRTRIRILVVLLSHKKSNFDIKKYTLSRYLIGQKTYIQRYYKSLLKCRKPSVTITSTDELFFKTLASVRLNVFLKAILFSCSWVWIRIPIPSTDPDPGQPNQCRSMRIWIRIHNTAFRHRGRLQRRPIRRGNDTSPRRRSYGAHPQTLPAPPGPSDDCDGPADLSRSQQLLRVAVPELRHAGLRAGRPVGEFQLAPEVLVLPAHSHSFLHLSAAWGQVALQPAAQATY
jgi:hypothetical protein